MSNARRSVAQLRAEKEARCRDGLEGIRLRQVVGRKHAEYNNSIRFDPSTHNIYVAALLEDAKRACTLLEHFPEPLERATAHECKAYLHWELGQTGDAMASFHEARELCALVLEQTPCRAKPIKPPLAFGAKWDRSSTSQIN